MTILWDRTVHTVGELVTVLSTIPAELPVEVYAEDGGFSVRRDRPVCVALVEDSDGGNRRAFIEAVD